MSKTKDPNSDVHKHVSHPFPNIKGNVSKVGKESSDTESFFRPMFNKSDSKEAPDWSGSKTTQKPSAEDALTEARKCGLERGIADGRLKACEMVQKELSPIIDDLKKTLNQHNKVRIELTEIYGNNSLSLALAIVEKIAGNDAFLNKKDLTSTQTVINKALRRLFDLELSFNPQDYKFIESLSACKNNIDWHQYLQVEMKTDDTLNAGDVICFPKQQDWDTFYNQVASALDKDIVAEE